MPSISRRHLALLSLLAVTVVWGWTFSWMKQALDVATGHLGSDGYALAVVLFMTLRFDVAALVLPLVMPGSRKHLGDVGVWKDGGLLALILLGGFYFLMFGLKELSPAVSAFLTSLYVVFTALIEAGFRGKRHGASIVFGVILATLGAGYISGPPRLNFDWAEWLTVICAFLFAVHIVVTDIVTRRRPALAVTLTSFTWMTLASVVVLPLVLSATGGVVAADLWMVTVDVAFLRPMLLSSILATVFAITAINVFQREMPPVRAAILYALEPVWAAVIAVAMGLTDVGFWLCVGGGTLFAGNLVAELGPRRLGSPKET